MPPKLSRILRILSVFVLLYVFLVSIKLMGSSFKMLGAGAAEALIHSCSNPFAGLFIGILATSLLQSSSTITSLVVGLVGGGVLPLSTAIPMIMGANVGTTVTNIIVSLSFVTRKEDFRRAFAGATVHDFFNLFSLIVFFPLELMFHIIEKTSVFLTSIFEGVGGVKTTSPIKAAINPAIHGLKHLCLDVLGMPETVGGILLGMLAIATLVASLVYLVKTMRSLILTKAEGMVDRYLFRNDFIALLFGLGMTLLVQSSSVTTSLVVPLVAAGVLTLNRCYPFTLGANLGTTCTALLASLATVGEGGADVAAVGVTAALAHLTFNIFGMVVFYPLRALPIACAQHLANLAVESKRWAIIFVLGIFVGLPLLMIIAFR